MRRVRGSALCLAGALGGAGLGACSLTSDFSGIVGVRPPPDAGDEVTIEAGNGDGEAGSDAGVRCSDGTHFFCRDFDQGVLTQGGWIIETNSSGTVQLDATEFVSPPASFRSKIPTATDPAKIGGILYQTVHVGAYTALRFGFDARIAACGGQGSTTLAALQPSGATAFGLVFVSQASTFAQVLLDQKNQFLPHALPDLPIARWFRFDIRLELSATVAKGVVSVDGTAVLTDTFDARAPGDSVIINLGVNATGPVNSCDVAYDNVTLDKE